jgi:hypothetical protein
MKTSLAVMAMLGALAFGMGNVANATMLGNAARAPASDSVVVRTGDDDHDRDHHRHHRHHHCEWHHHHQHCWWD